MYRSKTARRGLIFPFQILLCFEVTSHLLILVFSQGDHLTMVSMTTWFCFVLKTCEVYKENHLHRKSNIDVYGCPKDLKKIGTIYMALYKGLRRCVCLYASQNVCQFISSNELWVLSIEEYRVTPVWGHVTHTLFGFFYNMQVLMPWSGIKWFSTKFFMLVCFMGLRTLK